MSMSIQSDVEILSVQAVEYYAQKHHLSEGDVFDLFCKHQVFEKILIQHETLHQLDMEETFQYVGQENELGYCLLSVASPTSFLLNSNPGK